MTTNFNYGDEVKLQSFHNTLRAPKDIDSAENFWQFIGSVGKIVSDEKKTHPAYVNMGCLATMRRLILFGVLYQIWRKFIKMNNCALRALK